MIKQDETFLTPKLTYKTVVAPDDEVTNGFVKDKRFLPYVFEANEEGKYFWDRSHQESYLTTKL